MIRKKDIQPGQAERTSQPINLATLYSGDSEHAIDGSNRIMLLSDWRGDGTPSQFFVIILPSEDHLLICPPAVFEAFLSDLRADTADKTQVPELERELNQRVRRVSLDAFGRLPLPPDFLARTRIEKQGKLVGRFSKFEIWPCDRNQKSKAEWKQASAGLAKQLHIL